MKPIQSIAILLLASALPALAEVNLASVLSDHMVIQRDVPVHIWGSAAPSEAVEVTFRGASRAAVADDLGRWGVYLPAGDAGGPFDLTVKGRNAITLRDILVGDVWVASGQSNMEWPLERALDGAAEVAGATEPQVRLLTVKRTTAYHPLTDAPTDGWKPAVPANAREASAIGFFFARHLTKKYGVPIGLINTFWGGTPLEAWMSPRSLSADASYMPIHRLWAQTMEGEAEAELRFQKRLLQWEADVVKAKAEGKPAPGRPWRNNIENSWMPGGTYNAMIAPLTAFPIRGAIWYQGESNASPERAYLYASMFETMIRDWRRGWGVGDFPFLFVQLANFKAGPNNRWPELREAQTRTLSVNATGMAVTIDIGDPGDIHPRNKQEVGRRLALAARAVAYGDKVESSGPLFRMASTEESAIRVWFDHAAGLKSSGGPLKGFEVAGADGKYVPADARIDGATVVVSSASVSRPVAARYAWADNPEGNLYNGDGLPASPFRSKE